MRIYLTQIPFSAKLVCTKCMYCELRILGIAAFGLHNIRPPSPIQAWRVWERERGRERERERGDRERERERMRERMLFLVWLIKPNPLILPGLEKRRRNWKMIRNLFLCKDTIFVRLPFCLNKPRTSRLRPRVFPSLAIMERLPS